MAKSTNCTIQIEFDPVTRACITAWDAAEQVYWEVFKDCLGREPTVREECTAFNYMMHGGNNEEDVDPPEHPGGIPPASFAALDEEDENADDS